MTGTDARPRASSLLISQALTRPLLIGGCERTGFAFVVGAGAALLMMAWQSWSLVAAAGGAVILFGGLAVLRRMARSDPRFWAVYRRSRRYAPRYPARSTPYRKN